MATAATGKLATLEYLDLECNPFGEAGAEILADTIISCMADGSLSAMKELGVPNAHWGNAMGNAKLKATGVIIYTGDENYPE